jgi:hypothetical protein
VSDAIHFYIDTHRDTLEEILSPRKVFAFPVRWQRSQLARQRVDAVLVFRRVTSPNSGVTSITV